MAGLEKYTGCCTTKILYGLEGLTPASVEALKDQLRPTVGNPQWSHYSTVQAITTQQQEARCKTLRPSLESLGFQLVHSSKKWQDGGYINEGGLNTYIADAREFAAIIIGDEKKKYEESLKKKLSEIQLKARKAVVLSDGSGYPKAVANFKTESSLKRAIIDRIPKPDRWPTLRKAFEGYCQYLGGVGTGMNLQFDPVTVEKLGGFKTLNDLSNITPKQCEWFTIQYVADRFMAWVNGEFN